MLISNTMRGFSMRVNLRSILAGLAVLAVCPGLLTTPAFAQKAAASVSVKIGYFNYNLVKMSDPEAGGSDSLKNQAEAQLRADVDEGNKKLQKAKEEKKSTEDIQK